MTKVRRRPAEGRFFVCAWGKTQGVPHRPRASPERKTGEALRRHMIRQLCT